MLAKLYKSEKEKLSKLLLIMILFLSLIVRVTYVCTLSDNLTWYDEKNYHSIAVNLVEGNGYNSSYNSHSTRSWAPLLPFLLASGYYIFGENLITARIILSLLGVLTCYLIYYLGKLIYNKKVGIISSAILAFHPIFVYTSGTLYPVLLFSFLILLIMILIKIVIDNRYKDNKRSYLIKLSLLGSLIGLAMLTRPVIIFFIPFIPLAFVLKNKISFVEALKYSFVFFSIAMLTILPWTIYNYVKFKEVYFITKEGSHSFYATNVPWYNIDRSELPEPPPDIKKKLANLSKSEQDKLLTQEAIKFIFKSPFQYAKYYLKKFVNFWRFYPKTMSQNQDTTQTSMIISIIFYLFVIPFSFIGMMFSIRAWKKFFILYAIIFSFNIGYSFFITTIRYRLPIEPYIIIFTSIGFVMIYDKITKKISA